MIVFLLIVAVLAGTIISCTGSCVCGAIKSGGQSAPRTPNVVTTSYSPAPDNLAPQQLDPVV